MGAALVVPLVLLWRLLLVLLVRLMLLVLLVLMVLLVLLALLALLVLLAVRQRCVLLPLRRPQPRPRALGGLHTTTR